jgi:hypothetical protein
MNYSVMKYRIIAVRREYARYAVAYPEHRALFLKIQKKIFHDIFGL